MPDYRAYAREAAQREGCDPEIFSRQIQQESGFNPDAFNPSGATGIAQIIQRFHPSVDPTDPIASLDYAARWMADLHRQYGSYARALAAYNWGPGNVSRWDGQRDSLPGETRHYLDIILGAGWPEPGGASNGTVTRPPVSGRFRVVRVGSDRLNVRMAPSVSAPIVDRLAEGAFAEATGPSQDGDGHTWLALRSTTGIEGWAAQAFLELASAATNGSAASARYRVSDDGVRLRTQPGTDAPILVELGRNTEADDDGAEPAHASGRSWRRVRVGNQVGWVAVSFLDPSAASPNGAAGPAEVAAGAVTAGTPYRVVRVGADRLNLRAGPSLASPLVDRLADGTLVEALGPLREADGHTWLSLRAPSGGVGWGAGAFLEVVAPPGLAGGGAHSNGSSSNGTNGSIAGSVRFRVTDDAVRLRERPGTDASILAELRRGMTVAVVEEAVAEASGRRWRHVTDGARAGWIAADFLREATSVAGRYTFNADTPTERQLQSWTCSIRSTMWLLKSIGVEISAEAAQDGMCPRYVNEDLGLLDATGAGIVQFLRDAHGIEAVNWAPVSLDEVAAWAGRQPVAIGGRAWGHWSAVRDVNAAGDLVLANPGGTGPRYGQQTLNRDQFGQLGWFSAVTIALD